jgi:putative membrane protein
MSVLRHIVTAGRGLAVALMAPLVSLQAQVVAPGTNPGPPTTNPAPTPNPSTTPSASGSEEMRNDLPFLREAASANLMEIRLGQLAQGRASDPDVKQFAQRMVTDHARLEQELTSMASRNGIAFRAAVTGEHNNQINRLQNLYGQQFDQAYMSMMTQNHQTDVSRFENQSRDADSPEARDFAARSLPVLRQHLSLAQQVGRRVNAQAASIPNTQAQSSQEDVRADRKFIQNVIADNMLEVRIGELAERRAQSPAVKQLAERMVADHNRLQDEWVDMAARNGQPFKPGMGKLHRAKLPPLEKLSGREFDRAYITHIVQEHVNSINYLEREGRSARSTQVREVVEHELPVLRSHFSQAKQIGGPIGADTAATIRSERVSARR